MHAAHLRGKRGGLEAALRRQQLEQVLAQHDAHDAAPAPGLPVVDDRETVVAAVGQHVQHPVHLRMRMAGRGATGGLDKSHCL